MEYDLVPQPQSSPVNFWAGGWEVQTRILLEALSRGIIAARGCFTRRTKEGAAPGLSRSPTDFRWRVREARSSAATLAAVYIKDPQVITEKINHARQSEAAATRALSIQRLGADRRRKAAAGARSMTAATTLAAKIITRGSRSTSTIQMT